MKDGDRKALGEIICKIKILKAYIKNYLYSYVKIIYKNRRIALNFNVKEI